MKNRQWVLPLLTCLALSVVGCLSSSDETGEETAGFPPISVRAGVDRGTATVGDRIRLTIEVEYDNDIEIEALEHQELLGDLEVVESGRTELREVRGRRALVEWLVVRSGTVGSFIIPRIEVWGSKGDGERLSTSTDQVFLEILSVLPEGGVDDILGLKELEPPQNFLAWWLAFAAFGLISCILWWRSKQRRATAEGPHLQPHEVAYRDLEALRKFDFSDLAQLRQYYFSLSAILRRYIEARFQINATDLTTEEITGRLDEVSRFSSENEQALLGFLVATDGVKYAARVPRQSQIEEVYEAALGFVERTVPEDEADQNLDHEQSAHSQTGETGEVLAVSDRRAGSNEPQGDERFKP